MPIEFRCNECGRLLRTTDDSAGRTAQCPACGNTMAIPAPEQAGPTPFQQPAAAGDADHHVNPYASPAVDAVPETPYAVQLGAIVPTRIDLADIYSRTWRLFTGQWGKLLPVLVAVMAMGLGANIVASIIDHLAALAGDVMVANTVWVLTLLASQTFSYWLYIGQTIFLLKVLRGQPASFADIFTGGPYFWRFVGGTILFTLLVIGGTILLIIPGIIAALMFFQYDYLIIDRNLGVFDSFQLSKRVMEGNKLTFLAINLLAALLTIAVAVPTCCLGLLVAGPFFALLHVVTYLAVTGQPTAEQQYQEEGPGAGPQLEPDEEAGGGAEADYS